MFKDFRPKLQPKPTTQPASRDEVERLFRKGELLKAAKLCGRLRLPLSAFQPFIEAGAKKMYHAHQPGLVLSFIHETGINVGIGICTLLKAMFALNDFHGFLKQAYRFKVVAGIEAEIDTAIKNLIDKKQLADAEGWRRKLNSCR